MARYLIRSNATIKAVRAGDGRTRLNDGDGLYLLLFVKGGSHCWRFDYAFDGRRKTISFGTYPDSSLSLARKKADEARQQVRNDIDPSEVRQAARKAQQRARNGEAVDSVELVGAEIAESYDAMRALSGGQSLDDFLSLWADDMGVKVIPRLVESDRMHSIFKSTEWGVLDLGLSKFDLLIGDRPLLKWGRLTSEDFKLVLPISPRRLFVAFRQRGLVKDLNAKEQTDIAKLTNQSTVKQAVTYVYATSVTQEPLVRKHLNKPTQE